MNTPSTACASSSEHGKVYIAISLQTCNGANGILLYSGQQYELLAWLDNVTFPMEANFADVDFARETYIEVVRRIVNCGVRLSSGIRFQSQSLKLIR